MTNTEETIPSYVLFGAAGGIGSELASRLAHAGAHLLLADSKREAVESLAKSLGAESAVLDATRFEAVEGCVQDAAARFGAVHGVANCVGSLLLKPAHLTKDAEWEATLAMNLSTAFHVVRAAARHMRKEGGSVVLVSSAAARVGLPNHEAIAAAKAGVIGLTLSAAATYAPWGIRVNCVAPGMVDTPLTAHITRNESALKLSVSMHAMGRIGKPKDVASAIQWLLDPEQDWVTGQVIGVDGGLGTLHRPG